MINNPADIVSSNKKWRMCFTDSGCGIPIENLGKIFDPFFTAKEVGKGTGRGMHIACNIIKKHRGAIAVQRKVGTR